MDTNPFDPRHVPLVLDFDRVMEGREIAAQDSRLLALPVEILAMIINYINGDNETLGALALVNSDCRQLSRSCQFRSIVLDHRGDRVTQFAQTLRKEREQRCGSGRTTRPSLAVCIRRLTIITKDPKSDHDADGNKDHLAGDALRIHESHLAVISMINDMPNLDIIEYGGCRFALHALLRKICDTSIKSLKFSTETCCMGQDPDTETTCSVFDQKPLQPLSHLDVALDSMVASTRFIQGQDYVSTNIFDHCASTLRSLKLSHNFSFAKLSLDADFPQLSSLHVVKGSLLDKNTARSLFQSKRLSILAVDFSDSVLRESLVESSSHMVLKILAVCRLDEHPGTSLLRILKNSPRLEALYLGGELSPEFNEQLIPTLEGLHNLRTLSITWRGSEIAASSLADISRLKGLEQLHISTGLQYGTWYDWFLDHDVLLSGLRPLRNLQRIVFTRDSYTLDNGTSMLSAGGYYAHRLPNRGQWLRAIRGGVSFETVQAIWEGQHRYRMTGYAQKYAEAFRQLKSIHIGQLTFDVHEEDGSRTAILNSPQRCDNFSVLEHMFSIT